MELQLWRIDFHLCSDLDLPLRQDKVFKIYVFPDIINQQSNDPKSIILLSRLPSDNQFEP